ncbi:Piso0_000793 [Millerozyma farinosa CBS 7064]|uniref:Piso0_000793 protein n=1 Tax=Pichia sorbitophila (strain ATCC MYA-4447 / BCRC 22081 / CBS 7064 / NBRC 10061 / NRRL Y-12695) TaxID=559304 RepID=G8YRI9_PICSO|nr:Piso0_000793 [Millerozyma farinosa CBS 7064]
MSDQELKDYRIHIGNISSKIAADCSLLTRRISKFGTILDDIELHTKPLGDHFFGYLTLRTTERDLGKLKAILSGSVFMGGRLTISLAKERYESILQKEQLEHKKSSGFDRSGDIVSQRRKERIIEANTEYPTNAVLGTLVGSIGQIGSINSSMGYLKSAHTFAGLSGNVKQSPPTHTLRGKSSYGALTVPKGSTCQQYSRLSGKAEVILGRHRRTPRPASHFAKREQTLRILINGELKRIRCYKTKLWGLEKNKCIDDMTWRFVNGSWRSGDNHVIEKIDRSKIKSISNIPSNEETAQTNVVVDDNQDNEEYDEEEKEEVYEERKRNTDLLSSFISSYDFDKPMDLDDEDKEGGGEYFSGDDENRDSESEPVTENDQNQKEDTANEEEPPKDEGRQPEAVNQPDTLKSLFNPNSEGNQGTSGTFKLALSDDEDIEENNDSNPTDTKVILDSIKSKQETWNATAGAKLNNKGLFWPHLDSHFLFSQTQFGQLGLRTEIKLPGEADGNPTSNSNETPYETWFWSMRGEVSRECKRLRRDALRSLRKKNKKAPTI